MINARQGLGLRGKGKIAESKFVSQGGFARARRKYRRDCHFLLSVALLKYCGIRAIRHGVFSAVTIFL